MSSSTAEAHLGLLRVLWMTMSSVLSRTGRPGPFRRSALTNEAGMSMCVTESPNSYGRVFCISVAPSPTIGPWWRPERDACICSKMRVSSFDWNSRYAFGVIWNPRALSSMPCCSRHLLQVFLDLFLQLGELFEIARLGELGQLLQVDDADLGRLGGLFQLLEEFVDRFQLFLDFQRRGHVHRRPAGEFVLGGQLIDLILLAEAFDELHQLPGERAVFVAGAIPELFQIVQLFFAHRLLERRVELVRRLRLLGRAVEILVGLRLDLAGFVGRQDLALAVFQHGPEVFQAGAEAADLAGVDADGAGQLLLGEAARAAELQQMLEGRRHHVRRRGRRAGELDGVELLVGVDDAAEFVFGRHGESFVVLSAGPDRQSAQFSTRKPGTS